MSITVKPLLDEERCDGCGECLEVCPGCAIAIVGGKALFLADRSAWADRLEDCTYCGECEAVCPTGAITCPYEIITEG